MKKTYLILSHLMLVTFLFSIVACDNRSANTEADNADTLGNNNSNTQNAAQNVTLEVKESDQYGQYLTDGQGRSLYLFKADSDNKSNCYDDCAEAWPPLLTQGEPQAGSNINSSLIGTITREDGQEQVTYNNWPLYYYKQDQKANDTKGQDVMGHGAEWYLISPDGEEVHGEDHE